MRKTMTVGRGPRTRKAAAWLLCAALVVVNPAVLSTGCQAAGEKEAVPAAGARAGEQAPEGGGEDANPSATEPLDPEDFNSEEEYERALIESGSPQAEVPRVEIETSDEDSAVRYGYMQGTLVVHFYVNAGEERAREIVEEVGGVWVSDSFSFPSSDEMGTAGVTVYFPESLDEIALQEMIDRLGGYQEVESAVIDTWVDGFCTDGSTLGYSVDDPDVGAQTWLSYSRFGYAWNKVRCSHSVLVAVLDTGIDLDHPDLAGNIATTLPYDAYNQSVLQGNQQDTSGHGTMVAGIIAAQTDNAVGVASGSFNAGILPVRVSSSGDSISESAVERAFEYLLSLTHEPDVVNMSFQVPQGLWQKSWTKVAAYIARATELSGIACVAAAGNTYSNDMMYPAAQSDVISVAAIGANGAHCDFSTFNSEVDICAPGENVYTTTNPIFNNGSMYGSNTGTSFSAPQVSAAVALVVAQRGSVSPKQAAAQLEGTATDLGMQGRDDYYGFGSLNVSAAVGWTPHSPSTGVADFFDLGAVGDAARQAAEQAVGPDGMAEALEGARAANPDVVAWLCVPGCGVSLPVARREGSDGYYLDHGPDGSPSQLGCAYLEGADAADLSDPVTVVYAHTYPNAPLMFSGLHRLADPSAFAACRRAWVATADGRLLGYRIVEAAFYGSAHLGGLVDESDPASVQAYLDPFADPDPSGFEGLRRPVALDAASDRVLQLSTCTVPAQAGARWVVTGVLESERPLAPAARAGDAG